jgi:hypothetical protein
MSPQGQSQPVNDLNIGAPIVKGLRNTQRSWGDAAITLLAPGADRFQQ